MPWRVDSPAEVAGDPRRAGRAGHRTGAPSWWPTRCRATSSSTRELHDRVLSAGLLAADREGVAGKEVTPFLLDYLHRGTAGESLAANLRLVVRNAALAAEIAAAVARA